MLQRYHKNRKITVSQFEQQYTQKMSEYQSNLKMRADKKLERDLDECTFIPITNHNKKTKKKQLESKSQTPLRSATNVVDRMEKYQKVKFNKMEKRRRDLTPKFKPKVLETYNSRRKSSRASKSQKAVREREEKREESSQTILFSSVGSSHSKPPLKKEAVLLKEDQKLNKDLDLNNDYHFDFQSLRNTDSKNEEKPQTCSKSTKITQEPEYVTFTNLHPILTSKHPSSIPLPQKSSEPPKTFKTPSNSTKVRPESASTIDLPSWNHSSIQSLKEDYNTPEFDRNTTTISCKSSFSTKEVKSRSNSSKRTSTQKKKASKKKFKCKSRKETKFDPDTTLKTSKSRQSSNSSFGRTSIERKPAKPILSSDLQSILQSINVSYSDMFNKKRQQSLKRKGNK